MLTAISNTYYIVISLPGAIWRTVKNFVENTLRKWWNSHY
jgi:hypothetical protein